MIWQSTSPFRFRPLLLSLLLLLLTSSLVVHAQSKDWRPVTPEEMALKSPKVEPDADAEAIFWEVRIDDSDSDLSLQHYVRVKIFSARGREKYSKMDIPFTRDLKIKDLAARVIRPDGSIVEIKKEDIFEREIIKSSGTKVKAKAFAVPNIEPGVIVEYRYKEVISGGGAKGMRLPFQREIPMESLVYYYKPYNSQKPSYESYNFVGAKFVKDKDGYWIATKKDVPSFKEEPRMPPEDAVRPWMLLTGTRFSILSASLFGDITYTVKDPSNQSAYWGAVTTDWSSVVKLMTKGSGDIRKAAAEITAGVTEPEEKLQKIYEFCQSQIKNTTFDPTLTDDDRKKLPETKSLNDVLKRKSASSQFIDMLFGSLANAAGFEVRLALMGDRSAMFFEPQMTNERLIHPGAIAIRVGNGYKFFNPGVPFLPSDSLVWYEEDTWALLASEKDYIWVRTPLSGHEASVSQRTGTFRLLEDGTLEGEVQMKQSGHAGITYKLDNYDDAPSKREENFRDGLKQRVSTAEVSDLTIENVTDAAKPVVFRYKVRVPNYAQKTGKRMFFQPGFFEYGNDPLFSSAERKFDLFFRYPWSELDRIQIAYPSGYDLDNADAPGLVADARGIGSDEITMRVDRAKSVLTYERKFHFGGGGSVLFDANMYKPVKEMFDAFHKADSHTITLKQKPQ